MGGGAPRESLAGQPLAIQELHVPEVEALVVDAEPLPEHRDQVGPVGDVDPAVGLHVAGEILLADQLPHALAGLDAEPGERAAQWAAPTGPHAPGA